MTKNLLPQYAPDTALPYTLQQLERQIREFKSGVQGPTVKVTTFATIHGVLFNSFTESGSTTLLPQPVIKTKFTPPNGEVMLAFPEFDIFWVDGGGLVHEFPQDSSINPTADYIRLHWWLDFYTNFNATDKSITAYVVPSIDGALFNAASGVPWNNTQWIIAVRWRYIVPGSVQAALVNLGATF